MKKQFPNILQRLFTTNMRGDGGIIYIVMIMSLLIFLAGTMVGGKPKFKPVASNAVQYETPKDGASSKKKSTAMQMNAATAKEKPVVVTVTPTPPSNNTGTTPTVTSTPGKATTTPKPTTSSRATPTTTQAACSNIAVDFLVDESGSMLAGNKMTQVKGVLKEYIRTLPAKSLVAIQSFAEPPQASKEEQAFVEVGPNRNNIITKIDSSLNPDQNWATYMREGFKLAQSKLASKKSGYKYYLVLISDGVPEVDVCANGNPRNGVCSGELRNYDLGQDPTYTGLGQPNIPSQIKNSGVTIYSVGIFTDDDQQVNAQLETLLKNIASSPSNYFQADNAGQLTNIFSQLAKDICPS
jgi:hypothetical protein